MSKQAYADVFVFHPACEMAVANGTNSFQPNKRIQQFSSDLQSLPVYLMNSSDFLLVEPDHVALARDFFYDSFPVEQILSIDDLTKKAAQGKVQLNALQPWGWSPVLHKQLKSLKPYLSVAFNNSVVGEWQPGYKPFFSRRFALSLLQEFLSSYSKPWFIDSDQLPVACTNFQQVKQLLDKWDTIVLKAPFSASGRGIQVVSAEQWRPFHEQWGGGIIKRQGLIMVEPYLNAHMDVAFQYHVSDHGKICYLGPTFFRTDSTGQYIGNYLGVAQLPEKLEQLVGFTLEQLDEAAHAILALLNETDINQFHRGHLGVDALVYEDIQHNRRLYPIMEVNLRSTMGTLALALEKKYLNPKQTGFMGIHFNAEESFAAFYARKKQESGFRALTPSGESTQFGAWLQIDKA